MAACVREALQRAMRAVTVAWRSCAGTVRALVRARDLRNWAASVLHRPPASMPNTTRRHHQGINNATAPANAVKQGQREPEAPKKKQSE